MYFLRQATSKKKCRSAKFLTGSSLEFGVLFMLERLTVSVKWLKKITPNIVRYKGWTVNKWKKQPMSKQL